ncbi:hypothetical protein B0J13DRAFT_625604 [Dactylonectria estremocensis]|uniref:Uncharacterized protein n=1 Tax=Dactylonectria estremocensis TaxID=1079267 RepID=A0A9P9IZU7_9HYPO|nr:hypothetical protein B0J13DRAFT_625604 [Dactylonectria estremocensis]
MPLWEHIARHRDTLKRVAHHDETVSLDVGPRHGEEDASLDRPVFAGEVLGDQMHNLIAGLNLKCFGLTCLPEKVKCLFDYFDTASSLKILIRLPKTNDRKFTTLVMDEEARSSRDDYVVDSPDGSASDTSEVSGSDWSGSSKPEERLQLVM